MSTPLRIPLDTCADALLTRLAKATRSPGIAALDGATLLGERAMLGGMRVPGRTSAGGGCRLYDAVGDRVALNLARPADRELLAALFETDNLDVQDLEVIAARIGASNATALVRRGRSMGLAIASELETPPLPASACVELVMGQHATAMPRAAPRVLDLSALWAGPLAGHLLWLAGAEVVKLESRTRRDAMREGDPAFYALLNQGKASVVVDLRDAADRQTLLALIATSDIVIEAARPRALAQLGIDAAELVRTTPGLVWVTITGHGASGEAAGWVGFGDDCGVAGGLSAALRAATGHGGFVGDAIADPLTGLFAALVAWDAWASRRGGRFGLSMSAVVAHCLAEARKKDPGELEASLQAWSRAAGQPFPTVNRRPSGAMSGGQAPC
jgi:CoA-transferase family III